MSAPTYGSLFSGYGGLDMGVQSVLGGHTVWHCEFEDAPSRILDDHFPGVPNLGDITKVDWANVEPVDVITGGFPCQDVSLAGRRAGMIRDGEGRTRSGLWGHMLQAIETIRPRLVVAENVRGLLSAEADSDVEPCAWCMGEDERGRGSHVRALGAVLADLASVGYDAWWCGLRASDVGAPHGRFRVFIFAIPADAASDSGWLIDGDRSTSADPDCFGHERSRRAWRRGSRLEDGRHPVADAQGDGRNEGWPEPTREQRRPHAAVSGASTADTDGVNVPVEPFSIGRCCDEVQPPRNRQALADTDGGGLGGVGRRRAVKRDTDGRCCADGPRAPLEPQAWGDYGPAVTRWEQLTRPAPPPTAPGKNGPRLSPQFVEWMMGLPESWVTGVGLSRNDQLKALGNGVVPQQAASATRQWVQSVRAGVAA